MRRIILTLADDTTETHCGSCPSLMDAAGGWQPGCYAFRERIHGNPIGTIWTRYPEDPPKRLPECLAAERAASRLLDVSPEDAAAKCRCDSDENEHDGDAGRAYRVEKALAEHAAKAEVKP